MHSLSAHRNVDAASEPTMPAATGDAIRPGEVAAVDLRRECVLVATPGAPTDAGDRADRVWARLAVAFDYRPAVGDEVLVAGSPPNALYVIGVLQACEPAPPVRACSRFSMAGGARVELEASDSNRGEAEFARVRIFDERDGLLFEFDPVNRTTRVNVPSGDLELSAPEGAIKVHARRTVSVTGEAVSLVAREASAEADGRGRLGPGRLAVEPTGVRCSGEHLHIEARRSDYRVEQTDYRGDRASVRLEQAHAAIDRLETVASTVVSRAANVYRTVTGLTQLQTARMRTLVEKTYQMKARKALVRAETDYKLNARQIHLG